MKTLVFSFLFISVTSFAAALNSNLNFSLAQTRVSEGGLVSIILKPLSSGQVELTETRQGDCTHVGKPYPCDPLRGKIFKVTITPVILSDTRSADGVLTMKLTDRFYLLVSNGFNAQGTVTYTLHSVVTNTDYKLLPVIATP